MLIPSADSQRELRKGWRDEGMLRHGLSGIPAPGRGSRLCTLALTCARSTRAFAGLLHLMAPLRGPLRKEYKQSGDSFSHICLATATSAKSRRQGTGTGPCRDLVYPLPRTQAVLSLLRCSLLGCGSLYVDHGHSRHNPREEGGRGSAGAAGVPLGGEGQAGGKGFGRGSPHPPVPDLQAV